MTVSPIGVNDDVDATHADVRTTLASLEWLRRQLVAGDHPSHVVVSQILVSAADSPNGMRALTHPWTAEWIKVAVRLIDRDALTLLPDGQLAAHLGRATNVLASLRIGEESVAVRFGGDGIGWLPGTGAVVVGELANAGKTCMLVPLPAVASRTKGSTWPTVANAVTVEGLVARLCEEPDPSESAASWTHESGQWRSVADRTGHVEPPTVPLTEQSKALILRWPGNKADVPTALTNLPSRQPPSELVTLLEVHGIPVDVPPNALGSEHVRVDSSFDHLSLLSVRSPSDFTVIARAASAGVDPRSKRLQAHAAYIERRHLDAAATYAALLAEQPGDTDLWRDVCWALRHAGREEISRVWVLHPTEVVQVATNVGWQANDTAGDSDGSNLDRLIRYLEWITHALRAG